MPSLGTALPVPSFLLKCPQTGGVCQPRLALSHKGKASPRSESRVFFQKPGTQGALPHFVSTCTPHLNMFRHCDSCTSHSWLHISQRATRKLDQNLSWHLKSVCVRGRDRKISLPSAGSLPPQWYQGPSISALIEQPSLAHGQGVGLAVEEPGLELELEALASPGRPNTGFLNAWRRMSQTTANYSHKLQACPPLCATPAKSTF